MFTTCDDCLLDLLRLVAIFDLLLLSLSHSTRSLPYFSHRWMTDEPIQKKKFDASLLSASIEKEGNGLRPSIEWQKIKNRIKRIKRLCERESDFAHLWTLWCCKGWDGFMWVAFSYRMTYSLVPVDSCYTTTVHHHSFISGTHVILSVDLCCWQLDIVKRHLPSRTTATTTDLCCPQFYIHQILNCCCFFFLHFFLRMWKREINCVAKREKNALSTKNRNSDYSQWKKEKKAFFFLPFFFFDQSPLSSVQQPLALIQNTRTPFSSSSFLSVGQVSHSQFSVTKATTFHDQIHRKCVRLCQQKKEPNFRISFSHQK